LMISLTKINFRELESKKDRAYRILEKKCV
jgi:hypothetical protein